MELGLFGIALLLLVKEAGVPVPVPGDLVVLGAGVAAARGDLDPVVAVVAILVATVVGGIVQFTLVRGPARQVLVAILGRVGIAAERIDRLAAPLARGGARAVAAARMTPGVRIVTIPAAAVAGIPLARFVAGLAAGNAVFSGGHYLAGFAAGEAALGAVAAGGSVLAVLGIGLALVGAIGWWLLGRLRGRRPDASAAAWADACCPACLALVPLARRLGQ